MAAEAIRNIIGAHIDGVNAGYDLQQTKIDTILAAYDKALQDKNVNIPSYLHAALEAARNGQTEPVKVEPRRGNSMTEYSITGSLQGVLDGIRSVFQNYPAYGYGTRVHEIELGVDGHYAARVSRANSCD